MRGAVCSCSVNQTHREALAGTACVEAPVRKRIYDSGSVKSQLYRFVNSVTQLEHPRVVPLLNGNYACHRNCRLFAVQQRRCGARWISACRTPELGSRGSLWHPLTRGGVINDRYRICTLEDHRCVGSCYSLRRHTGSRRILTGASRWRVAACRWADDRRVRNQCAGVGGFPGRGAEGLERYRSW